MNRITLTLTFFLCISGMLSAQIVNIPDANFKAALLAHNPVINTNGDGEIQVSEATLYNGSLDVGYESISDLTGIEAFTALIELRCYNNNLTALDVTQNTALTHLRCYDNNLTALDVTQNTALIQLECYDNNLTALDVTQNLALTYLRCNYNSLTALDVTQNLALTHLRCYDNNLTALDVTQNTALIQLECYDNNLTALDVTQNTALIQLLCYDNSLTALDVTQNTALTHLRCNTNNLTALDVTQNTALIQLECYDNNLTALDVTQNLALTYLRCNYNSLTALDVTQNTALTGLLCGNNNLTVLDVMQNTALITLWCNNNSLTALDITQNTALTDLWCYNSSLTALDVTQNIALTDLMCYNNSLIALDVTQNLALTYLSCSDNSLTALDVTQNTVLTNLLCDSNNLTALDVRNGNNSFMNNNNFRIHNNPNLICVSVDDPTWSTANWTFFVGSQTSFSSDCSTCSISIELESVMDATCMDSGLVSTTVSGGTPPLNYVWQPLVSATVVNDTQLLVGTGGVYNLSVTDNTGCELIKGMVVNGPRSVNNFDLVVNGFSGWFRPGLNASFNINVFNDGCVPVSGQIQVVYNGPLSFMNASNLTPDVINGDTLKWNFTNWTYDTQQFINDLTFMVDSTANIGDQVCFDIQITPLVGDADTINNIRQYCYDVVNSYDPNDKQVYPQGECDANYILPNDKLTYTVRFQNTGNAEAINIFILDSLDENLDVNSVRIVSKSHEPLITEVIDSNVLNFRFDNILLPDSNTNEPESHGYVIYEIDPLPGLSSGTEIRNSAAIYFDLNEPIITNTVFNTIIDEIPVYHSERFDTILDIETFTLPNGNIVSESGVYESVLSAGDNCDSTVLVNLTVKSTVGIKDFSVGAIGLSIYPNPASNSFTISVSDYNESYAVEIANVLGQKVYASTSQTQNSIVPTEDWYSGVYSVTIKDKEGYLLANKKVVVSK